MYAIASYHNRVIIALCDRSLLVTCDCWQFHHVGVRSVRHATDVQRTFRTSSAYLLLRLDHYVSVPASAIPHSIRLSYRLVVVCSSVCPHTAQVKHTAYVCRTLCTSVSTYFYAMHRYNGAYSALLIHEINSVALATSPYASVMHRPQGRRRCIEFGINAAVAVD
jgi:hypothetical protein